MRRITVDLDTKRPISVLWCLFKAFILIEKIINIEVKRSSSGNFHVIIWTRRCYGKDKIYRFRELLGDDPRRIRLDKKRKIAKQTLWDKKIRGQIENLDDLGL